MLIRVITAFKSPEIEKTLTGLFSKHHCHTTKLSLSDQTINEILQEPCDLLIVNESNFPQPICENINILSKTPDPPSLVILTDVEDRNKHAEYIANGCETVLCTGIDIRLIYNAIEAIIKKYIALNDELLKEKRKTFQPRLADFISLSAPMQSFMSVVNKVVNTDSSILVLGETGVGKEWLARAIHRDSKRFNAPFIPVNCAALPDNLIESELFGHERGAFTGAIKTRRGAFELAHNGTIFLDEIGEMPLHLQSKLLRVIQERQFQKLGGESLINVNVRIIAATNKDLMAEVKHGTFRKDLYFRLGVVCLNIPPLCERKEDIPNLVSKYIKTLSLSIGVQVKSISDSAMKALIDYHWPGNIREIINVLERAILLADSPIIELNDLPEEIAKSQPMSDHVEKINRGYDIPENWTSLPWKKIRSNILSHYEAFFLDDLLKQEKGNIQIAADKAGYTTRSLYYKIKKYGLESKNKT